MTNDERMTNDEIKMTKAGSAAVFPSDFDIRISDFALLSGGYLQNHASSGATASAGR